MYRPGNPDGTALTIQQVIRGQIHAANGRDAEANPLFDMLETNVVRFDHVRFEIPSLTRAALLHPSVCQVLGISGAVFPIRLPRWAKFPVIRLAHVIMTGCACDNFALPATKIGFGSEILVAAAFAISGAKAWADSVSSYVITGRFNSDLGAYVNENPIVWRKILEFRDSQAGTNLRAEVLEQLATNAGVTSSLP